MHCSVEAMALGAGQAHHYRHRHGIFISSLCGGALGLPPQSRRRAPPARSGLHTSSDGAASAPRLASSRGRPPPLARRALTTLYRPRHPRPYAAPRGENAPPEMPNPSRPRACIGGRFLPLPKDASPASPYALMTT